MPFFFDNKTSFRLHPPVYKTHLLSVPIEPYRHSPSNWRDAISFFWNVGFQILVREDVSFLKYRILTSIGKIPKPTRLDKNLIQYVFREIGFVAEKNGAALVIVILGSGPQPVEIDPQLFPENAHVVDAHQALLKSLSNMNLETYQKRFAHWKGTPPKMVDTHPNEAAHKIIAGTLIGALENFAN